MTSSTTTNTINVLQRIFSQFGLPETIVSDNGTQFTSTVFQEYCNENAIKHIRSPPFHPQSNGQAERFVDTFKRALIKLRHEGTYKESLQTFLFSYRATPCASSPGGRSPAENFIGRKLRTTLDALQPHDAKTKIRASIMEQQFNRHHGARPRQFQSGDLVFTRDYRSGPATWKPGQVLRRRGKVLYEISCEGKIWIRHVNQLRLRFNTRITNTLLETFHLPYKRNTTTLETDSTHSPNRSIHIKEPRTEQLDLHSQPRQSVLEPSVLWSPSIKDTVTASSPPPLSPLLRRSERQRHAPENLEVNPKNKSYTYRCPT